MEDKKFVILLTAFTVISLTLVLGLGAMVVLDVKGRKDNSSATYKTVGGASPQAPSLLERP